MVRVVWAKQENRKQLYLIDKDCEFIFPVKRYLDHLSALEKSPHALENYCRHLCLYFTFLEQAHLDWQNVAPDDLVHFVQWLRDPQRQVGTLFEVFLAAIDNFQFRCMVLLMREGGLRVGETLGLLIQDLEFHRNGMWFRRRSGLENGALAKGLVEREERFIDLSPALCELRPEAIRTCPGSDNY